MIRRHMVQGISCAIGILLLFVVGQATVAASPAGDSSVLYGSWSLDYLVMAKESGVDVSTFAKERLAIHVMEEASGKVEVSFNQNLMKMDGNYVSAAFESKPDRIVEVGELGKPRSAKMRIRIVDRNHIRMMLEADEPGFPLKRTRDYPGSPGSGPLGGEWKLDDEATLSGMTDRQGESFGRVIAKRPGLRSLDFEPMMMKYDGRYFAVPQWPINNGPMRVVGIYSGKKKLALEFVYLSADVIGLRDPKKPNAPPLVYARR